MPESEEWAGTHSHGLLSLFVLAYSSGPWEAHTAGCSGTGTPTHGCRIPCSYPMAVSLPISTCPKGLLLLLLL